MNAARRVAGVLAYCAAAGAWPSPDAAAAQRNPEPIATPAVAPGKTLDIYYIDTEGGQATLFVSPAGETVLVDTGYAGTRDPDRIVRAMDAAGVKQVDYLLITHFHEDHIGGYLELAKRIPIRHYVDHGPTAQPERNPPSRQAYDAVVKDHPHLVPKPGDVLPVAGLRWTIVSSAGEVLRTDIAGAPGAGAENPYCAAFVPKDIELELENAQSLGSLIEYGKFRTVDLGDLLWNLEQRLMCPSNRLGTVDVFLTSHHGVSWSNSPVLVHALRPRVAVMNNAVRKGAQVPTFETLETSPGLENLWQLHWSVNGLLEHNVAGVFIANMEDAKTTAALLLDPPPPATSPLGPPPPVAPGQPPYRPPVLPPPGNPEHAPAYWIKVSAQADGAFTVTNSRNGFSKTYGPRA